MIQGYDRVPHWLARDLGDALHLKTQVTEIAWERGNVELTLRSESGSVSRVTASRAIVTVPLGVLQTPPDEPGGIRFRPDPPRIRKALNQLAMGSVVRLVVWFRDFPWEERGAYSYAKVGGSGAAKLLSKPIESTLYFAGEATDPQGRTGTVEGAIATGLRAARQVSRPPRK